MIKDIALASKMYNAILKSQGQINKAFFEIWPFLTEAEKLRAQGAVGSILAETILSGLGPLELEHPSLAPANERMDEWEKK
jgi:hypothetical protein